MTGYIAWFDQLTMHDVGLVGGKNASLGEIISHLSQAGVNIPANFATTTEAYLDFWLSMAWATFVEGTISPDELYVYRYGLKSGHRPYILALHPCV